MKSTAIITILIITFNTSAHLAQAEERLEPSSPSLISASSASREDLFSRHLHAYEKLADIRLFAFGTWGVAGMRYESETIFREVVRMENSPAIFRLLFEVATPEGKCYALVALRELDPDAFKECMRKMRADPPAEIAEPVFNTPGGEPQRPVAEVLNQIEKGGYQDMLPGRRLKAGS